MLDLAQAEDLLSSADQRLLALAKGNIVRRERAEIKAKLGRRELYLDDVLEPFDLKPCLVGAPILEIISAARGFGSTKARWALDVVGIPPHRKTGHIAQRQRKELIRYLIREHGQAFYGSAAVGDYLC